MTGRDEGRLHSAVLVSPRRERRRDRKTRKQAAKALLEQDRAEHKTAAKAKADALAAERKSTVVLPRAGEPGPAALRTPGRLRLPRHQDTSATLAGAYPFLAEGGLGSEGVFVGQDLYSGSSFVCDPWVPYQRGLITAPNMVLAGIVGSGKSALAKSLYTRSIPFGRRVYVPGDPKGEHTAVAEADSRQAREAKLDAIHESLAESVAALATAADWRRAMEFAARFRSRSAGRTGVFKVRECSGGTTLHSAGPSCRMSRGIEK